MPSWPRKQMQAKDMQFQHRIYLDSYFIDVRKSLVHSSPGTMVMGGDSMLFPISIFFTIELWQLLDVGVIKQVVQQRTNRLFSCARTLYPFYT